MGNNKTLRDLQDKCRCMSSDAEVSVRCGGELLEVVDIERISTHPEKVQIVVEPLGVPRVTPRPGLYSPECYTCNQLDKACLALLNILRGNLPLSPESRETIESIQNFLSGQSEEMDLE